MLGYSFGQPVMMQLGEFQFGISTAAYQELSRSTEWRWADQEVIGHMPVLQFIGPGGETITLPGVIYPEWRGGYGQLDTMRGMGDAGEPLQLVDGRGGNMGRWVIESVEENQAVFADAGRARRIEFNLSLRSFPEPAVTSATPAGGLGGLGSLIPAGATGALPQLKGLAGSVSSAAKSLSGTLAKAASQVQAAVTPFTSVARDALGSVLRAGAVVGELQTTADRALAMVGVRPIEISALAGANSLATKAAGLIVSAESAGALLRNASTRLDQLSDVPANATRAMRDATMAADKVTALARQTAAQAATIGN